MSQLNVAKNPINLVIADEFEVQQAKIILNDENIPDYVLKSYTAFPGELALYRGYLENGSINCDGWIGNLK